MSTGYTYKLVEEGQSFRDFTLTCARAFLGSMRDEPMSVEIPDEFSSDCTYHQEQLAAAKTELAELDGMVDSERISFGEVKKAESISQLRTGLQKCNEENARIADTESQVRVWEPPTQEHMSLKEFMLEQLAMSRKGTLYYENTLRKTLEIQALQYWTEAVESAERDIEYHETMMNVRMKDNKKESDWVKSLKRSLEVA